MRDVLDCDPDIWEIYALSGYREHFAAFFALMIETPDRIAYAIRDRLSGRLAGTSSMFMIDPRHRSLEIGYTWFRPEFRGTYANPEGKLLMMEEAFGAGALRVQFGVDTRNARSQAAMRKLGAKLEGIVRRHKVTWTGYKRDTAMFSVVEEEWGTVKEQLRSRLRQQSKP
jgi:RimJ/RimL family protein N-acetyltransferase